MASPMRMRGGGAVEIGCAVIAAAGADAGAGADDDAIAEGFTSCAENDDAPAGEGDFAWRADDDAATVEASP
jgi:hypothetical protein